MTPPHACSPTPINRFASTPPRAQFPLHAVRVLLEEGITLTTNISSLTRAGEAVAVSVTGMTSPSALDLIALYVPATG